jgi:hypothetical protein
MTRISQQLRVIRADPIEAEVHDGISSSHHAYHRRHPEHLLVEAKQLAAERHLSLTRLFEDSLRLYLGEQRLRRTQTGPEPLPLLRDPVPVEGIDLKDTSRLWNLA